MAVTHAVISSSITSLILGRIDSLTIGLSILGSQLPDLDSSKSLIGQIFFPISRYLENNYPHRSITHSLLATAFISAIALSIGYYFFNDIWYLVALPIGHVISCFSDTFTKQGVQLFYPNPAWAISVSNPHRRLRTGSPNEYWVLVIFSILLFINFSILGNSGSLNNAISLQLGLRNELIQMYNKDASNYSFTAKIEGYYKSDRTPINQEFQVIDNIDNEFIITNGKSVYKTGENIIISKIQLNKNKKIKNNIETIIFEDEDIKVKLQKYLDDNTTKYCTGKILVDYPEEIEINKSINSYENITISGNSINLDYYPLKDAIAILSDQYGIGKISIRWKDEL